MKDLSNVIIATDFDGTFADKGPVIPERNLEAIERFKKEGGLFCISTGRAEFILDLIFPDVYKVTNCPCILSNGSYLYDYTEKKKYNESFLDESKLRDLFYLIRDKYPETGIRVIRDCKFITPDHNSEIDFQLASGFVDKIEDYTYESIPIDRVNKITVCNDEDKNTVLRRLLEENFGEYYTFVKSGKRLVEVQAKGMSKGAVIPVLKKLMEEKYGKKMYIYGVGDFNNDIEMLEASDFACCPENAVEEVKKVCQIGLCRVSEGSIADLIEKIESKY